MSGHATDVRIVGDCGRSQDCTMPGMDAFPAELRELDPYTPPEGSLTWSALTAQGIELSETVEVGDFIAVEVDSWQEPRMAGQATAPAFTYECKEKHEWMGQIAAGDRLEHWCRKA